ncbi:actin-like ATPase domain-containing protein [Eremomyces bilateralis CBS 781.70]|uniref:Phosphotransferase n=1 Tax=Eremomyces bilateralis CBS 781.70 TaxID=1392243 RepID=A0A6G1GA94_9PEZI|nr:actin-like ATPase domain-containing protein [Eremomyces bilateralis CBS 781.70]KAF1814856.1 actin-like ATPase domain-containing protein [Eremomyces bilateralis CBS 781.70]
MLPSLVQTVIPSVSPPRLVHDVIEPSPPDHTMDDLLRECKTLFEEPLNLQNLLAMSGQLQDQFRGKMKASNISMLPSYIHTLPTGQEQGTYLALDVGGSSFRAALVALTGSERGEEGMKIIHMETFRIDDRVKLLQGKAFFEWMAERIEDMLRIPTVRDQVDAGVLPMGLSWSFPIEQTSVRGGMLLDMGKGFNAVNGIHGVNLGELITIVCRKRNLNVRMDAIINDGQATFLSRAYRDPSTRIALILGTGTNAAIILPTSSFPISKFGDRPQSWHDKATHVLVNAEFSMFGKGILPTTRWDDYLNMTHTQPDFQPMEYLISGRYLGEIVRLICLEAIKSHRLFNGAVPDKFEQPYAFDTGTMATFESDDTLSLSKSAAVLQAQHPLPHSHVPALQDLRFVRQISKLVSRRAAAYLACGIHALWSLRNSSEGFEAGQVGRVSIGCNGAVIERYPQFKPSCQSYLDEMTRMSGGQEHSVVLEDAGESSIYGAAVAVACLEGEEL